MLLSQILPPGVKISECYADRCDAQMRLGSGVFSAFALGGGRQRSPSP